MPKNCVILLVEDDPNDAFFVRRALKELGFPGKLRHVTDAEEARSILENQPSPDIVVADSALTARGSGVELLEWIRASQGLKDVPFIILSGGMSDSLRERAVEAGASAVLTKTSVLKETTQQLREILGHLPPHCRGWLK